jgi:hypothetical protein
MELAMLYGCPKWEAIARTPPSEYAQWQALWLIQAEERKAAIDAANTTR